MSTYTAAVLPKLGEKLKLESQPIPEAVPGSAVVKVLATSISGNTNAMLGGQIPNALHTPVTPSSTVIGRIHTVGPDATKLKQGQLVWIDFYVQSRDDEDVSILQGYVGGNEILESAWLNGAYGEYGRFPLERIWALNEDILVGKLGYSFADLAYLGTTSIALAGLLDIDTRPGDVVIVAPATGIFGGSAVHAAISLGARVIACGRNQSQLSKMAETFKSSGRFTTVQMTGDVEKDTAAIRAASGSDKGADRYIDFSPHRAAESTHMVSCISALRRKGKVVMMGAIFGNIGIPYWTVMHNNISIQGRFMFDRWHGEQAIKLLESGHMQLGAGANCGTEIVKFKLQDITKALDEAEQKNSWGNMIIVEP